MPVSTGERTALLGVVERGPVHVRDTERRVGIHLLPSAFERGVVRLVILVVQDRHQQYRVDAGGRGVRSDLRSVSGRVGIAGQGERGETAAIRTRGRRWS